MKSAFNQIPLHFADRNKTAFSTPDGDKYQFNRLCFGLKNSPKAFQSIAQEVLGDLLHNGALVYIDDIILFTKTIDEHFELLGFVVTPEGILIDKDKSVSINEFPVPKDQKQIKPFLGCCNFYRRYIKNFAKRALPLTNLLRKDTPFEWTSETQEAFDDIKKAILNPPVLALPDQNAELQITTDASSRGIEAVLEQKYPITLKPFLLGRKFKVFADHKPLAGFLSNKNLSSKILRWKLALEEFNYDIHYIRGSLNSVADHLSRYINKITIALPDSKDLINMQREDSVLSTIIQKIDQNDVSPQISNYFINGEGLLCHLSKRPSRSPRPKFEGPYRVIERFCYVNYRVQHVEQLRKRFNTHVNRMTPFIKRFSYLHLKNLDDLQPDETEVKGIVPSPRYNLRARAGNSAR
ncbi:retrovirus-related Pol polyprotein from transposon 17.6 [Trichonephila clavipes]|nr:retrovirus-related Pol polyprotein from transposon 17.6 [Trichonephila clavipes]